MDEIDDDGFEDFPDGWEDSSLVSSVKRNRDGSLTVKIGIAVSGVDAHGSRYWEAYRTIRLDRRKEATDAK